VGPIARVLGFFSFVNTLWVFAVLGIAVSIGPSAFYLLQPLHDLLRRLLTKLYRDLLLPLLTRLHTWGVLELGAWGCCFAGLARGVALASELHGPAFAKAGEMMSFTASALAVPALAYTTFLRGRRTSRARLATACYVFFVACCMPPAVHFGSTLYGYAAVVSLFGALGFGVWVGPLCFAVGFTSDAAMHRIAAAALALVLSFCAATAAAGSAPARWLAPFASAVSIFGTTNLFLSLLIMSSQYYAIDDASSSRGAAPSPYTAWWRWSNALMVGLLVGLNAAGHILGLEGMANTCASFTVLFALQKYGEFHLRARWNGWLLLLGLSLVTWRVSLFLHVHPEYVSSVLGGSMMAVDAA
jgi:hypothetical protein